MTKPVNPSAVATSRTGRNSASSADLALSDRPEDTILVVAHSLPLAYLRDAAAGTAPRSRMDMVDYAQVLRLEAAEVERAVCVLDAWAASPRF